MNIIYESSSPMFAIGVDPLQFYLAHKQSQGKWHVFTYYPNLPMLVDALLDDLIREADKVTEINQLKKQIAKARDTVLLACKGISADCQAIYQQSEKREWK